MRPELLTAAQVHRADALAEAGGISTTILMENAGCAVADAICARWSMRPVLVVCGSGNNGGDGFVAARVLKERRWPVTVVSAVEKNKWGDVPVFAPDMLESMELCIDAVFGVGLSRAPEGLAATAIAAMAVANIPVVAVDIPSGIAADNGEAPGVAVDAAMTVTFQRAKPGLFLLPGKVCAGEVQVADIGIPEAVMAQLRPQHFLNMPTLWREQLPMLRMEDHKYTRGHAMVAGGGMVSAGAAKMAALAALHAGAGLVSIACTEEALPAYASSLMSVMTKTEEFASLIADRRVTAMLVGPGNGVNDVTRAHALAALATGKPCVLDADALTVFAEQRDTLFTALHPRVVLTPHEGEFVRLFDISGSKVARATAAAKKANCVVLLKGNDTVIAAPDGRIVINANAPPWLATAGAGDVLGGIICGLMAQGMEPFSAACAGTWMHGEAATLLGRGLIAEELPATLRRVFGQLSA